MITRRQKILLKVWAWNTLDRLTLEEEPCLKESVFGGKVSFLTECERRWKHVGPHMAHQDHPEEGTCFYATWWNQPGEEAAA